MEILALRMAGPHLTFLDWEVVRETQREKELLRTAIVPEQGREQAWVDQT